MPAHAALPVSSASSSATAGYDKPPPQVAEVMHAQSPAVPSLSPTGETVLLMTWVDYPSMARVAEPFLKLAGVRVEPKTRRRHDTPGGYGIPACARAFSLLDIKMGSEIPVVLPPDRCAEKPVWSADGKRFAFRNTSSEAVELWIGNVATGRVRAALGVKLNPMLGSALQWMPDQQHLLVKLVPDGAGAPPLPPNVPAGPSIQETGSGKGESSTYEARDTLTSTHDEALFDYYASAQLAVVDANTSEVRLLGAPGPYTALDPSPNGEHVLVDTLLRPYSYVTTFERFPHTVEVWDTNGKQKRSIATLPAADRVPVHGVPMGPRDYDWRATDAATLVWAEALDGGDWKTEVPARDKVMTQHAPFTEAPVELLRTTQRFGGLYWSRQTDVALLHESDDNRSWTKTFVVDLEHPDGKRLLWDRSTDEKYKHPGSVVWRQQPNGQWLMAQHDDAIFLAGQGASPEGDRPFLDRLDLKTKESTRMFRSEKTGYESFVAFAPGTFSSFLTWHQSPTEAPNLCLRALGNERSTIVPGESAYASTVRTLTHFADPAPVVRGIKKKLVKYKRADGLDLSFTIYTPPGYVEGTRIPTVLYAYPLDYADAFKAGQVSGSEQMFTRLKGYKLLLLAGYAVIDDAAFPIVGDPKKAYDTYLEQLVADADAAVKKAVEMGVADPERIGVTGHSHGALMTVNLLAHSKLFRAGVATSGSYNKTLTPFGFQSERRSVWAARDVYLKASPFFSADTLKTPLLLVHGADDANPGTTPLQATKLFEALRGNGGTARLVMLPHEPHWYAAMESNEQLVAEMIRWFDTHVKNAPPR